MTGSDDTLIPTRSRHNAQMIQVQVFKHSCAMVCVGGHYTVFMMLVCVASQAGTRMELPQMKMGLSLVLSSLRPFMAYNSCMSKTPNHTSGLFVKRSKSPFSPVLLKEVL